MGADPANLGDTVRRYDPDRFATAMLAPEPARSDLMALYAFNFELARVREVVSEAMLGEIRLQWWREAVAEIYEGRTPRHHEVVLPLAAAMARRGLPQQPFQDLIDARGRDLDAEGFASLDELADYARATVAPLFRLALDMVGGTAFHDLAAPAGVAYGLAGILRAVPFHAGQGRLLLPQALLDAHGVSGDEILAGRTPPGLDKVVAATAQAAGARLAEVARARPGAALPALLPLVLARRSLRALARNGHDPFKPVVDGVGRPLALLKAQATGRI